jgi:hypothetical protein
VSLALRERHWEALLPLKAQVARVFIVGSVAHRLEFVGSAVERGFLYSAWRSPSGDFIYSHANAMALTALWHNSRAALMRK